MSKGTRHSRKTWSYATSSLSSSWYSSHAECRAIVQKCEQVFVALNLLYKEDFEDLHSQISDNPTKAATRRISKGKGMLQKLGVPSTLIFSTPYYLLVAPRLRGLISRMCRLATEHLPDELHALQDFFISRPELLGTDQKEVIHVEVDGQRTTLKTDLSVAERRHWRSRKELEKSFDTTTAKTHLHKRGPKIQTSNSETAMFIAFQEAQKRKA